MDNFIVVSNAYRYRHYTVYRIIAMVHVYSVLIQDRPVILFCKKAAFYVLVGRFHRSAFDFVNQKSQSLFYDLFPSTI